MPWSAWSLLAIGCVFGAGVFLDGPFWNISIALGPENRHWFSLLSQAGDSKHSLVPLGLALIALYGHHFANRDKTPLPSAPVEKARHVCLFLVLAISSSGILVDLIKIVVGRARPRLAEQFGIYHFAPFTLGSDYASFPSGHSNTVFAIAIAASFLIPRFRIPLLALATIFASGRVFSGAHYVSDVIGGALLALATTYGWRWVFRSKDLLFSRDELTSQ